VTFTLENAGTASLNVSDITSSNIANFEITSVAGGDPDDNLPLDVNALDYETFVIAFTPTETGSFISEITIVNNDPELSDGFVFSVTGESISLPELTVYESGIVFPHNDKYDFGSVQVGFSSDSVDFEIKNTGTAELQIDSLILTGTASLSFELDTTNTNTSINPGASTFFSITFKPIEEGVFKNKSQILLEIGTNDPSTNPYKIRPWGKGTLN
jgi:hypothetical protein